VVDFDRHLLRLARLERDVPRHGQREFFGAAPDRLLFGAGDGHDGQCQRQGARETFHRSSSS
jgi:hypothetical protein